MRQEPEVVLENAAPAEEDRRKADARGEALEGGIEPTNQTRPLVVKFRLTKCEAGH